MTSYTLETVATEENFDEKAYLTANPDVADAVRSGKIKSGRLHFNKFGKKEGRMIRLPPSILSEAKKKKLQRIKPLLRQDMPFSETPNGYDFLSTDLRSQFNIVDTYAVSSNSYDRYAMALIEKNENGWVLDCGAGQRPVYFDHVVNFEIADYETTDVLGIGEILPFVDGAFDVVLSLAVLEHVKDPFQCAREMARVLKPGGRLMCCAPLLAPLHGYPHHYYNMTGQGLKNLFVDTLVIDELTTYESMLPIWALTWILQSWAAGLEGKTKADFLKLRIRDLMESADKYLHMPFVKELSMEKNLELACCTALFAHKPMDSADH
jgi:SAM-dependent methyltransferase